MICIDSRIKVDCWIPSWSFHRVPTILLEDSFKRRFCRRKLNVISFLLCSIIDTPSAGNSKILIVNEGEMEFLPTWWCLKSHHSYRMVHFCFLHGSIISHFFFRIWKANRRWPLKSSFPQEQALAKRCKSKKCFHKTFLSNEASYNISEISRNNMVSKILFITVENVMLQ